MQTTFSLGEPDPNGIFAEKGNGQNGRLNAKDLNPRTPSKAGGNLGRRSDCMSDSQLNEMGDRKE